MRMNQISSYKNAEAFFNTCRDHYKGKPLPANWRLYKDDSGLRPVYWISMNPWGCTQQRLCDIRPDDTVQFHLTPEALYRASNSIVMVLHKIFHMGCTRKRQGIYEMGPMCWERQGHYTWPTLDKDFACEYFQGLTFDLKSNRITNPQPDLTDRAIPDVRKAWRKDLTRFKRGLKARAKVGALTGYIDEIKSGEGGSRRWSLYNKEIKSDSGLDLSQPEYSDAQQYVLECMRTEQYPEDLLRAFVYWSAKHNLYSRSYIDNAAVFKYVDQMFNKHSLDYRKAYGVFKEVA